MISSTEIVEHGDGQCHVDVILLNGLRGTLMMSGQQGPVGDIIITAAAIREAFGPGKSFDVDVAALSAGFYKLNDAMLRGTMTAELVDCAMLHLARLAQLRRQRAFTRRKKAARARCGYKRRQK